MRYHLTGPAGRDLREIRTYIARDDPEAARRMVATIRGKCRLLSQHPALGRPREDLQPGIRSFPVGAYLIFYQPAADGIQVVRVLHGARDIPALFESRSSGDQE